MKENVQPQQPPRRIDTYFKIGNLMEQEKLRCKMQLQPRSTQPRSTQPHSAQPQQQQHSAQPQQPPHSAQPQPEQQVFHEEEAARQQSAADVERLDEVFRIGKHKGSRFSEARRVDTGYAAWAGRSESVLFGQLKSFAEYCRQRYG